jgi:hypothetical protein
LPGTQSTACSCYLVAPGGDETNSPVFPAFYCAAALSSVLTFSDEQQTVGSMDDSVHFRPGMSPRTILSFVRAVLSTSSQVRCAGAASAQISSKITNYSHPRNTSKANLIAFSTLSHTAP